MGRKERLGHTVTELEVNLARQLGSLLRNKPLLVEVNDPDPSHSITPKSLAEKLASKCRRVPEVKAVVAMVSGWPLTVQLVDSYRRGPLGKDGKPIVKNVILTHRDDEPRLDTLICVADGADGVGRKIRDAVIIAFHNTPLPIPVSLRLVPLGSKSLEELIGVKKNTDIPRAASIRILPVT